MMDLEKLDVQEMMALERWAKAATPGPWRWVNPDTDEPRKPGEWRVSLRTVEEYPNRIVGDLPKFIVEADEICGENMEANASFIAAANPATVLALIAEVRALREDAAKLEAAYLRCIVETSDAQAVRDGVIEALELIVAAHDMHCDHHVNVSSHSHDLARMAQEALDACEEPK